MNIDVIERDGTLILRIEGELDLASAPILDQALVHAHAGEAPSIVVDLDQLAFMDSAGLQMLLRHAAISSQDGRRLRFTEGSPQVRRLVELTSTRDRLPPVTD